MGGSGEKTKPGRDHHKDAYHHVAGRRRHQSRPQLSAAPTTSASTPPRIPSTCTICNATILHLLGLDHERLTFKYQGREFRLTDIAGRVVRELLA